MSDQSNQPRMTKRDLQRIETRKKVFDAAIEEFLRVGVEKAQIEAIVKKADVSVGTFYRNFASKNDVIIELMNQYLGQIAVTVMENIQKPDQNLEEMLNGIIDPLFLFIESERDNPLIKEVFSAVQKMPTGDFEWVELPFLHPIIECFEQYQLSEQYDAVRLTRLFFTSMFGFITMMNPVRAHDEAKAFIKIFLAGIKAQGCQ